MEIHDRVVELCIRHFSSVVKRSKFKQNEWTVLSCIVLECPGGSDMSVVALGTGSKCIGQTLMSERGDILNDSHAEVICRRAFLRYLYYEMLKCSDKNSSILEFDEIVRKFKLKDVKFHFFTTHVPCGDAAIFPKQNIEDFGAILSEPCPAGEAPERIANINNTNKRRHEGDDDENSLKKICTTDDIHRTGAKCLKDGDLQDSHMEGPAFHVTGAVRTKPGRGDPTLSASCSDKIARWCCVGVQGALLSLLLTEPVYFTTFTLVGETPFCKDAISRALYGKTENLQLEEPYFVHKLDIRQAKGTFVFAKAVNKIPSPISIAWLNSNNNRQLEVSVEGKRQGITKNKINTDAARLKICKVELFRMFLQIVQKFAINLPITEKLESMSYWDVKHLATEYQDAWTKVKKAFKIWTTKEKKYNMFKAF